MRLQKQVQLSQGKLICPWDTEVYGDLSKILHNLTNIDFESLGYIVISVNGHNTNGDFLLKAKVAGEAKIYRSRLASFPFTSELNSSLKYNPCNSED